MQAEILPLSAGWGWILQGIELFRRQPMAMLFWSLLTTLLINLSILIPIIGQIALVGLTPMLTFLTLCACRNLAENRRMLLGMWLAPLQAPGVARALMRLGLLYLAVTFAAAFAAVLPFLGPLGALADSTQSNLDFARLAEALTGPFMVFGLFYLLISAVFWHTPALVGWHALPLRRALFYSMVACWRNKLPIIVYLLLWGGAYFGMHALIELLSGGANGGQGLAWLILPVDILATALLYCSFYPIYVTIFQPDAAR